MTTKQIDHLESIAQNLFNEIRAGLSPAISNGIAHVDPFQESALMQRNDKPPMQAGQFQFYYYYHRPSGHMILRAEGKTTIIKNIETKGIDTWIIEHSEPPLKYLVTGYARRTYVKGDTVTLS